MSLPNKLRLVATVTVDIEYADSLDDAFKEMVKDLSLDPGACSPVEQSIADAYNVGGVRPALEITSTNIVKEALMEGLDDIVTPEGERDEEVNLDVSVTIKTVGEEA